MGKTTLLATWAAQGGQRGRISYFENSFCRSRGVGTTRKVDFTPLLFILHVSGVERAKTAGFLHILYTIPLPIDPTLTAQGGITIPPPVRFTRFWNRMYKNSWLFTHSISTPPPHRPHFEQPRGRSVGTDLAVHFGSICRGKLK